VPAQRLVDDEITGRARVGAGDPARLGGVQPGQGGQVRPVLAGQHGIGQHRDGGQQRGPHGAGPDEAAGLQLEVLGRAAAALNMSRRREKNRR
jgi:hypothetical protein